MVKYVLHYFKANVRAESIRLAFKLGGVDFEEVNFEMSEWPKLKPKYPTRQVPVLEVDGKMIGQTKAILRYLAKEFGLYGKTPLEAAYIDQAMDTVEDIWPEFENIFRVPFASQAAKAVTFLKDKVPPVYEALERLLDLEQAGDFFVGNSITAADIFFFGAVDVVNATAKAWAKGANSLEKYPKLTALMSRIAANPKIAAWLAVQPAEVSFELNQEYILE
ncbi:hematopoietic prostaglandin D synthase-like [Patiria miniata]|uniref:Glutathione S-transferase n=1 Tax=Patiria miniata TaxID=46514 RepID=A0A914BS86_PATMI|nr:hematopoietic prostaglandin D synthase-like [Patiria miniata]